MGAYSTYTLHVQVCSSRCSYLEFVTDLTIEYGRHIRRLFWLNHAIDPPTIGSCMINGSGAQLVNISLGNSPFRPTAITCFMGSLYIMNGAGSSAKSFTLYKANTSAKLDKPLSAVELPGRYRNVFGMSVYSTSEKGSTSCLKHNGGCEQLCLPISWKTRVCRCMQGYIQANTSCKGTSTLSVYFYFLLAIYYCC